MIPNNIRIRIRSKKQYSLTSEHCTMFLSLVDIAHPLQVNSSAPISMFGQVRGFSNFPAGKTIKTKKKQDEKMFPSRQTQNKKENEI